MVDVTVCSCWHFFVQLVTTQMAQSQASFYLLNIRDCQYLSHKISRSQVTKINCRWLQIRSMFGNFPAPSPPITPHLSPLSPLSYGCLKYPKLHHCISITPIAFSLLQPFFVLSVLFSSSALSILSLSAFLLMFSFGVPVHSFTRRSFQTGFCHAIIPRTHLSICRC